MHRLLLLFVIIVNYQVNLVANEQILEGNSTEVRLEYVLLDENNPCSRVCTKDAAPMTCRYKFELEWYHTLSKACFDCPYNTQDCFRPDCIPGDGNKRPVVVVNRQMPGPSIEVCVGDEIIVDVVNHMASDSTTIHWHGQHQRFYPYMDGVPYVTQCPILPGNTFRYQFKAINSGTHFWHSHTGFQRADGAFGPLIVKVPKNEDFHRKLYDYDLSEHVLIILDWGEEIGLQKFLAHHHNDGNNKPATLLVNGHGRFKEFDKANNASIYVPPARFTVSEGFRYRFRIINAGFLNCPIEISIDNHTLTIISSDGADFNPVEASSLVTYAGERFDFVVNANQTTGLYWIRFRGLMDCDQRFTKAFQVGVLEYKDSNSTMDNYPDGEPVYDELPAKGTQVNALNVGTENTDEYHISMPKLEAVAKWDSSLKTTPDYQFYVGYDFYKLSNPHFHKFPEYGFHNVTDTKKRLLTPQLNHITMKMPTFPLLSQRDQINFSEFCNSSTVKNCTEHFCECPHVLQIPLNSIVEMILVDEGFAFDANHPLHLHGHAFRVVAMEKMGKNVTIAEVKARDKVGKIRRNLLDAPLKDTVTVPDGGYTIIRFNASNPGYWLFHCHIEFHAEIGMALVLKVGENEEMLPVPKYFPTCGDYIPEFHTTENCTKNNLITKLENIFPGVFGEKCDDTSDAAIRNISLGLSLFSLWLLVLLR